MQIRSRIWFLLFLFGAGALFLLLGCNENPPQELQIPKEEPVEIVIINSTASLAPTAAPTPMPTAKLPLAGYIIGIDPGHQAKANGQLERLTPKSRSSKKQKVTSGTSGRWSDVPEFEVTLTVGLLLRDLLEKDGAEVVMTRTVNDIDISNMERALVFNDAKTDYALRIHCNGAKDETKSGASILIPRENPYIDDCKLAAKLLLDEYSRTTGVVGRGIDERGDQTGFNWCERMIINIELGYMSNKENDAFLTDPEKQKIIAQGLENGILRYFEQKEMSPTETPTPIVGN